MVLPGRGCGLRSPLGRFYLFPESVEEKGLQGQSHKSYVLSVGSTEGFTISMLFPQGQLTNGAGLIQGGRENGP